MATLASVVPSPADRGTYVDGEERTRLAGVPLILRRIDYEPAARFGPRWVVSVAIVETGEIVAIGLKANPTRDTIMAAIKAHLLDDTAEPIGPVVLEKVPTAGGESEVWTFRDATADDVTPAPSFAKGDDEAPAPEAGPRLAKGRAK